MSQFFASGGQSVGASASASVLPMNIQGRFPLGWTGWLSLQLKGLSRVFSSITVREHKFDLGVEPTSPARPGKFLTTEPLGKPLAGFCPWQREPEERRCGKEPRGSAGMKEAGGAGWLEGEVDALNVGRRFEQFCFLCFRKGCAWGFPGGSEVENLPAQAGDTGLISDLGRSRLSWRH